MWWWPFFSGGTSTSEVFDNAGVFVLTDAYIYEQQYYYRGGIMPPMMADAVAPGAPVPAPVEKGQSKPPTSSVRQNFPETWLWSELTAGLDGSATLTTTVPDTITSWILTAFAVSSTVGLGIAPDSAKLTVFKPFFVSVNLPYSVIRGEEFALQVTIFNYLPEALKVVVILQQSDDFKVRLNEDMAPQNQPVTAFISVPSNDAVSVYFWIIPVTLGQIPIEVSATSGVAADAVKVNLLVKPEGVSQEYSTSVFFSLSAGQTDNVTLAIALPLSLVPGSEYFFVTAIGDLLGQSLSGLGKLLNMPYGCGEQTMLSFAPDVYVLKYLKVTGQDHGTDGDNARKFILDGYQRELTFQREDGSFSAFGDSDLSGSVWLSAFVIKCFHEAKEFIPWDDAKIAETLDWLSRKQAVNGSFAEPVNGRVIHSDMQGGSAGGLPMTAYVLISLLENADNSVVLPPTFNAARDQAVAYLEYQLNSVMSDPYALSLICYAFTMANSSLADTCLGYLNALAINKDGMKYWHKVQQDNADEWVPPYQQARAVDIEMTAYALLTYTLRNDFSGGVVIAKWLVSQRNSLGGFSSTQDTVVALQALTRFAALTSGSTSTQNLLIHMTAGRLSHEFSITAANALVLQSVQIPSDSAFVNLQVSGAGVGLVQLNVRYNIFGVSSTARRRKRRDATTGAGFKGVELSLKLVEVDDTHLLLTVCASRLNGNGSSGMSIVDVGLLTGYVADNVDDLKNQGGGVVRRVDVGKTNLAVYLDELIQKPLCLRVLQKKVLIVDKIQPAVVTAYLYYDPGQRDTLVYKPVTKNVSFCDQCPDCCNHQLECETGDDSDKRIYKVVEKPNRPKRPPGKLPVLGNTIPDGVVTYVYRAKLVAKGAGSLTFSIHAIWPLESYSANNPPEAQLILDINLLDASLIPVSDLLVGGTYIVSGPHDEDNNYNVERLIGA
jgi:CD109 antigen